VVYVPGDSAFNEAFAVTVEQEGLARWLRSRGRAAEFDDYLRRREAQLEFVVLARRAREHLQALFGRAGLDEVARRAVKATVFADLERDLRALQARLGPKRGAGIGAWIDRGLNNAQLASVATYWDCVPGFEKVLAAQAGDLGRFYAEVRRLGKLAPAQRRAQLCQAADAAGTAAAAAPAAASGSVAAAAG
jgi:predicted aminopeptidase